MLCACVLLYAMRLCCAICYVPMLCYMLCGRVVPYALRPCSTTLSNSKNQICVVLYAMRLYCTTSSPHVKNQICVILYACCTTVLLLHAVRCAMHPRCIYCALSFAAYVVLCGHVVQRRLMAHPGCAGLHPVIIGFPIRLFLFSFSPKSSSG